MLEHDTRFISHFWKSLNEGFGTTLSLSTSFHPQTDGQSKRVIQILEDMFRACVVDFKGGWVEYLTLMEFSYKNRFHSSISMALFEALYGRKCKFPVCWDEIGEKVVIRPELV